MIVKVQRPLVGSPAEEGPEILVYDKARAHLAVIDAAKLPDWLAKALEASPKVFVEAEWKPRKGWAFVGVVGWQSW